VVTSRAHPPFFVFSRKDFWRVKANEQDNNIFGEGVKNYKKPHKTLRQSFLRMINNYKKQHTNKWRASIPEIFPKFVPKFQSERSTSKRMKTASLGLLEVMVVRVNAGGDAIPLQVLT